METGRRLIRESQIIQRCIDIARNLGEGGRVSERSQWANAKYSFSDDLVTINYEIYAMGDEGLRVDSHKKVVFEAKERVNSPPINPNQIIAVGQRRFEILTDYSGEWEQRIEDLYNRIPGEQK